MLRICKWSVIMAFYHHSYLNTVQLLINLLFSFLFSIPFYLLSLYQCLINTITRIRVHLPKFWAIFVTCKNKYIKCVWGYLVLVSWSMGALPWCYSEIVGLAYCVSRHSNVAWIIMPLIIYTYIINSVVFSPSKHVFLKLFIVLKTCSLLAYTLA